MYAWRGLYQYVVLCRSRPILQRTAAVYLVGSAYRTRPLPTCFWGGKRVRDGRPVCSTYSVGMQVWVRVVAHTWPSQVSISPPNTHA
jgi:hypothetical protein